VFKIQEDYKLNLGILEKREIINIKERNLVVEDKAIEDLIKEDDHVEHLIKDNTDLIK